MSKEKNNNKGKAKVSFRSMIIAMIVALLGFLGFGGLDLGNGDGADVDGGNKTGVVSEVDDGNENQTKNGDNDNTDIADIEQYNIYIRQDEILIPINDSLDEFETLTLTEMEEAISNLSSDTIVVIYDDGAVNKTYEEVLTLINNSGLQKIEDTVTN